jgi:hypothetical protein
MTEAKALLDTRALEIAERALVLIERHERDCARRRDQDERERSEFRAEVRAAFRGLYTRHWVAAGALLGTFAGLWARTQGWL